MPDVEEQIRRLADHRVGRTHPVGVEALKDAASPRRRRPGRVLMAATAAALFAIVGLVVVVSDDDRVTETSASPAGDGGEPAMTEGTLVVDSDLTMTADHQGTVEIVGDGVTLDCNQHLVEPSEGHGEIGIEVLAGTVGVMVKNCVVAGFVGIQISVSGRGVTLDGNLVDGDAGEGFGIFSDENLVINNRASGAVFDGFLIQNATGNRLEGNRADGNAVGFSIESANGNTLVDNEASDNSTGYEVALGSSGNTLTANIAEDNRVWGIEDTSAGDSAAGVVGNIYVDNVCRGNGADSEPIGLCTPVP